MRWRWNMQTTIMGAIALMIVIAALAFTFEPLATVVTRSYSLPPQTVVVLRIPAELAVPDATSDILEMLANTGATVAPTVAARVGALLRPAFHGASLVSISSEESSALPVALTVSSPIVDRNALLDALRRLVAYALPTEQDVTLPDETHSIEIIADPANVKLAYEKTGADERWSADGLPVPLAVRATPDSVSVSTSKAPWFAGGTFLIPGSCRQKPDGTRIVTYISSAKNIPSAFVSGISAYLSDFSCFQAFSTLAPK